MRTPQYATMFAVLILSFLSLYVLIPVLTTPGNSFMFQLTLFTPFDYIALPLFSLLTSLVITSQVFLYKRVKTKGMGPTAGGAGVALLAVVGKVSCITCLAQVLSLVGIGFGGVLFFVNYRIHILVIAFVALMFALYMNMKRISSCLCV